MIKALKYFWKEQPIALSVFVLALVCLLFFGVRFVDRFLYFHDPAHRNQALEPWMTPRYVGMSYNLPKEIMFDVMGPDETDGRRERVGEIAARMGISLDQLEERVRQAKVEFIAQKRAEKAAGKKDHWKGRQEGPPPQEGRQTP